MKTLIRILLVQICCMPLFITDAMAREQGRGGGARASASRPSTSQSSRPASRPTVRPTTRPSGTANRNPFTQSQVTRPSTVPRVSTPRPSTQPATPSRPQTRPATRPTVPERPANRPESKPIVPQRPPIQPSTRPATKPDFPNRPADRPTTKPALPNRPGDRPNTKPDQPNRPANRPATKPDQPNRPGNPSTNRPNVPNRPVAGNRPDQRPQTKPGNVNYPNAGRPVVGNRPGNNQANRPAPDRRPVVTRPGQNSRPVKLPNFDHQVGTRPGQKPSNWWDAGRPNNRPVNRPGINNIQVNNNVHINNNFSNNVNWSTHRKHWGYNPWWNRPATRPWYGGSWNCGWNSSYYRRHYHHHHYYGGYYGGYRPLPGYAYYDSGNDVARAIGWGLVGWSLGRLVYDSGYQTYTNPYPVQPLPSSAGGQVTYTQPITVVAAETAPSEEEAGKVTEASESSIIASQEAFKQMDYLTALDGANKAIAEAPGDGALHEYRALVLFALGKFSEAAGVLNPVLAGGPGWDWTTMISLYSNQETYMNQLAALENYAKSKADAADARFLLGYHYMVCGHLSQANAEFSAASRLQPADSVSSQLRDLTAASSNNGSEAPPIESEAPEEAAPPQSAPVPLEKLTGTWVSDKGTNGTVALVFKDDGKFVWAFKKDDKSNEFGGDFSMNDDGLLVLDAEESQMVAEVSLPQDNELKFVLSGGPPGDPGLIFVRK